MTATTTTSIDLHLGSETVSSFFFRLSMQEMPILPDFVAYRDRLTSIPARSAGIRVELKQSI
jgi:hypothetical protein